IRSDVAEANREHQAGDSDAVIEALPGDFVVGDGVPQRFLERGPCGSGCSCGSTPGNRYHLVINAVVPGQRWIGKILVQVISCVDGKDAITDLVLRIRKPILVVDIADLI